jgi:hypothetical protein
MQAKYVKAFFERLAIEKMVEVSGVGEASEVAEGDGRSGAAVGQGQSLGRSWTSLRG